jgi:hypothetical protein
VRFVGDEQAFRSIVFQTKDHLFSGPSTRIRVKWLVSPSFFLSDRVRRKRLIFSWSAVTSPEYIWAEILSWTPENFFISAICESESVLISYHKCRPAKLYTSNHMLQMHSLNCTKVANQRENRVWSFRGFHFTNCTLKWRISDNQRTRGQNGQYRFWKNQRIIYE